MKIFRTKYDNILESPVRTLYGRKGNLLLAPLDLCILQINNGIEEFRPPPEVARLIAAPIQEHEDGRMGVIAQYEWPPNKDVSTNPVVTVQLAPSANVKGIPDLRVLASQVRAGDKIKVVVESKNDGLPALRKTIDGSILTLPQWHAYPDLVHRVMAYSVEFQKHVDRTLHGSAIWLATGELVGMLISTQNQPEGICRALVYPA